MQYVEVIVRVSGQWRKGCVFKRQEDCQAHVAERHPAEPLRKYRQQRLFVGSIVECQSDIDANVYQNKQRLQWPDR